MSRIRFRSRYFLIAGVLITLLSSIVLTPFAHENGESPDGLSTLIAGNQRFIAGHPKVKDYLAERPQLAQAQHPYAIILTCADSRLSPEIIFDESLGKLFVVRTAGHVIDPVALGSIEYAVEHLHVNLLFVLGHDSCGAVKATISGGETTPNIRALLNRIKPAVDKALARGLAEKELLDAAITENVRYQMQRAIFESELLSDYVLQRKLTIAGGVYHLGDGRVEVISADLAIARTGSQTAKTAPDNPATAKDHPGTGETPSQNEKAKATEQTPTRSTSFAERVRSAYEKKSKLLLTKTMLMRDEQDRCATDGCRSIPAGEPISLESPLILNIMGRQQVRVRYKGRPYYILADADAMIITDH